MTIHPVPPGFGAYAKLVDQAHTHGYTIGIKAGTTLHKDGRGSQWRDLDTLYCVTGARTHSAPIVNGNIEKAAEKLAVTAGLAA